MEALEWDDANRSHIARHGVTPEEVQELFDRNPSTWDPMKRMVNSDSLTLAIRLMEEYC